MTIVKLTLKAAESFEFGDLRRTRKILLKALQKLRESCENDSQVQLNVLQTVRKPKECELDRSKGLIYSVPSPDDFDSDEYASLYNSIFVVNDDVSFSTNETAATLLFNVALLHHRAGIKYNDTNEYFFALEIYMKALDIFKSVEDQEGNGYSPALVSVIAALFYNMAQIFTTFFRSQQAEEAFDMLEKILQCIDSEENMSIDDFEFFQLNLRLSRITNVLIAPAA